MDLFRDENVEYAINLMKAGVATELPVMPGAPHGYMAYPGTTIGERYYELHLTSLAKALSVSF